MTKFSLFLSCCSLCVAIVSAIINIFSAICKYKSDHSVYHQPFDLIVRPSCKFREIAPCELMMEIQQTNYVPRPEHTMNERWDKNSLQFVLEDIGDGDRYYGITTKLQDPYQERANLLITQYFDKVYITRQGEKKHKRIVKEDKQQCKLQKQQLK